MLKIAVAVLLLVSIVKSDDDGDDKGRDIFDKFDSNHNAALSQTEFRNLFLGFDTWPEDGLISEHEFIAGWTQSHSVFSEPSSTSLFFLRTDLDHDGLISAQDVDTIFSMFDENGNQGVDKTEFCDAFTAMFYKISHC